MTTDEKLDLILQKLDQYNEWQQVIAYADEVTIACITVTGYCYYTIIVKYLLISFIYE